MNVVISNPLIEGKYAVTAVANPKATSDRIAKFISLKNSNKAITPTARNPGISLTPCNQPIFTPSNSATSITKLFNNAIQVE